MRARHALVHRDDLRLAAHHPRLASAASRAGLRRAWARDRRRAAHACCSRTSATSIRWAAIATVPALALGAILKRRYWSAIDIAEKTYTAEAATGLGRFGTVRRSIRRTPSRTS